MGVLSRRTIGILILVLIAAALPVTIAMLASDVSLRMPAWWPRASLPASIVVIALVAVVRLGCWRIALGRKGAGLLLAALVLTLIADALLLFLALVPFRGLDAIQIQPWANRFAALFFAAGVLRSGLAKPWVGWTGVIAAVIDAVTRTFANPVLTRFGLPSFWAVESLSAVGTVLGEVFLLALALNLLGVLNQQAHVEQAHRADAVS